jgi:GTPase Era involved in 16S rRNA processing
MERFLGKIVFLELYGSVNQDWRKNDRALKNLG